MAGSLVQLIAVAQRHAEAEGSESVEAILATMEGEPVYEFHPAGRRFSGMADTRRYYEHFVAEVRPRIVGSELHSEAVGANGVAQEYSVTISHPGDAAPTRHRIMAILTFGNHGLSGERMFSDERLFRTMLGPMWDELEPITA